MVSIHFFEELDAREFDERSKHFLFSNDFINSHKLFSWWSVDIVKRILALATLVPWVPEVFLACGGNFRCWPKAEAMSGETGNRARHPGYHSWDLKRSLGFYRSCHLHITFWSIGVILQRLQRHPSDRQFSLQEGYILMNSKGTEECMDFCWRYS